MDCGERYWKRLDGKIVTDSEIRDAIYIVRGERIPLKDIPKFVADYCYGLYSLEVVGPTVETFLKSDQIVKAIRLYYNTHKDEGISLKEARDTIYNMREGMKNGSI